MSGSYRKEDSGRLVLCSSGCNSLSKGEVVLIKRILYYFLKWNEDTGEWPMFGILAKAKCFCGLPLKQTFCHLDKHYEQFSVLQIFRVLSSKFLYLFPKR